MAWFGVDLAARDNPHHQQTGSILFVTSCGRVHIRLDYNRIADMLPEDFAVPRELNDLLNMKFERPDFDTEKQLVQKYTRLKRDVSHSVPIPISENDRIRKSPVTTAKPTSGATTDASHSPPSPPPRIPGSSRPSSGVNEFELRHSLVHRMMAETKQEQNICHFFLESSDWNYDTAIDMFNRMQMT